MKLWFIRLILLLSAIAILPGSLSAQSTEVAEIAGDKKAESAPKLTAFQAVVLGFVEGATEYLPVSSTGHLLIVQHLMGMDGDPQKEAAAHSLAICIQCGAILAVLVLYFGRICQILKGMIGRDSQGLRLLINLIVAFFPAAVIGLLFNDWIEEKLFGVLPVAVALFVGGVIILVQAFGRSKEEFNSGKEMSGLSARDSLIVGLMQCLAFWPGFSRSLATILGCRIAGLRMTASVEFSFLLGLLTLSAATAYKGLKDGPEMIAAYGIAMPLLSLVIAFIAAVISVRFMVGALNRFGLAPFGYYRIILAIACLLWLQN